MRSFRIATIACVLSVAVPAAAGASQANRPDGTTAGAAHKLVTAKGPYGATPAPGTSPKLVAAKGPYGATPAPGTSPKLVAAKGPYGATPAAGTSPKLIAAKGPYGPTPAPGTSPKLVAAKGPYGAVPAGASPIIVGRRAARNAASPRPLRAIAVDPDRFDWADAAIGAGGTLAAILVASAGTVALTRRRTDDGQVANA